MVLLYHKPFGLSSVFTLFPRNNFLTHYWMLGIVLVDAVLVNPYDANSETVKTPNLHINHFPFLFLQ